MKKIFSLLGICSLALFAKAQTPFSLTTTTYTQNFNTLDTTSTPSSNLPSGWSIFEVGTSGSADNLYVGGTGSSNTGNVYSFGAQGNPERALGSLRSGTNRTRFGVAFTNNTGSSITSLNINFTGEQWRSGDTASIADSLYLEYSTTATGINDTISSWTTNWSTMFNSVTFGLVNSALNGNLAANQSTESGMITVTIPVGGTIYLRWNDVNLAGSDDGMAIDDLSITFGTGAINQPLIVSTVPVNNATGVAFGNSNLTVNFDKNLTLGTGNIYVNNLTDATSQTIPVSSTSVSGMTATIPNVTLLPAKSYAVQFDSTCYKNGTFNGYGIYNNTTWAFQTVNPKPLISSLTPADNTQGVLISTTSASVTFDKNIALGTGSIRLFNITDNTLAQTITLPNASVTVSAATATIGGLTLVTGKTYAMQYDSTAFNAAGFNSLGIYDTTTWNFSTTLPPPPPVTTLNESFTGCAAPLLGTFTQVSLVGNQQWGCTTFGRNDANGVRMNGGNTTTSFDNTDWLISPSINAASYTKPMISFWAKRRFVGITTKEVYVSNNYIGDPSTATWTLLAPSLANLDTIWTAFKNTDMTSYKNTPFNIAFKYVSTSSDPSDELNIDDVVLSEGPLNTNAFELSNQDFYVIGNASNNQLNLAIATSQNESFNYSILDMNGRTLQQGSLQVNAGKNQKQIALNNLSNGIYFIKMWNRNMNASAKFIK
jgi:hypothetical protein